MTLINSALFNAGWQEEFGIGYHYLQLPETGERLTRERFDTLHASSKPQAVLMFLNSDAMVETVIRNPLVIIASDGEIGHPRNAGTYCRILARYVRELHRLTLMDAIRKMSYMPAQELERSTPQALKKGRMQVGADADIDVFDLNVVEDRSTYAKPRETSVGMQYVLVGGVAVIDGGKMTPIDFRAKPSSLIAQEGDNVSMKRILTAGVMMSALAFSAAAQDWYHDRDARFHGDEWRPHLFLHVRTDLEHVWIAVRASDKEQRRLERTKEELTKIQGDLDQGRWDNGILNDVIDSMRKSANDERLAERDRAVLSDDLIRLKEFQNQHNHR